MANNPYVNRVDIVRGGVTDTLINITDTTAVAADVASGKYFYLATGERVQGTASGGGGGTGGVTQDQDGYLVLSDQGGGGGGATNCVCGTFTTGSTGDVAETVTIPYTGSGYPVGVFVNTTDTNYSALVLPYAIKELSIIKRNWAVAPTYSGTSDENYAMQARRYKNSTSDGTVYSIGQTESFTAFSNSSATNANTASLKLTSNNTLSVFVKGASGYGFAPNIEYTYYVVYSS